ncbi:DUF4179 domain-containing protein [Paenibacillus sp. SC116]|uniref:DUF4179 domain-containing protein n=1 Tax=Paenibacillus sp. SC116 TaxID=2968986 RepID=UPI00215B4FCD|nr:DUF4179 domain-containing protein [Paenibacillus sp. SC116]MCR8842650.1 DUF4179 domain-containing protein [Paenibacillus sp. SC116]
MKTIEEKLREHKLNLDRMQVPSELEGRLRDALRHVPAKKSKKNKASAWIASAAAALILIVGIYQYPALAYYSEKFFKTNWSALSFSEVTEQGYGQKVDESITLRDGTVLTINGVMADDNVFLMYYTIDRPAGIEFTDDDFRRYGFENVKGFLTNSKSKGGSGGDGKNKSQFEGTARFEPVSPFSRTLTVTFYEWINEERVFYPISFKFEANKAMKSIIKQDIAQSIKVDQGTIYYESITASPTSTIIKGHYEMEYAGLPRFSGKTKLYINGIEVEERGGEAHSPEFERKFDMLPTDKIESIELVLDTFTGFHKLEQPISLAKPSERSIKIGDEKLWIRSVTKTDTGYNVVIARREFTLLKTDNLAVKAGGNVVPVSSISESRPWDLKNNNIMRENTYSFHTMDKPESLLLEGFTYLKTYNKKISIPVEK